MINLNKLKLFDIKDGGGVFLYSDSFQEDKSVDEEKAIIAKKYNLPADFDVSVLFNGFDEYSFVFYRDYVFANTVSVAIRKGSFNSEDTREILNYFRLDENKVQITEDEGTITYAQLKLPRLPKITSIKKLKLFNVLNLEDETVSSYVYAEDFREDSSTDEEVALLKQKYNRPINLEFLSTMPTEFRFLVLLDREEFRVAFILENTFGKEDMRKILVHLGFDKRKKVEVEATGGGMAFKQYK